VSRIIRLRARRRYGPHRLAPLAGHPLSTIYAVLRRAGVSRLRDADRVTAAPIRYVACHPGALLHQDHKKLGRIPPGGRHRMLGRERRRRDRTPIGYDHFEVVIDDASRVAVVLPVPDESGASAAMALEIAASRFGESGIHIERVLTDNAFVYRGAAYAAVRERLGARPYRSQTNGTAERFIKTALAEWAYARRYRLNEERLAALPRWVDFHNHGRPHTALRGLPPMQELVKNVRGNHI